MQKLDDYLHDCLMIGLALLFLAWIFTSSTFLWVLSGILITISFVGRLIIYVDEYRSEKASKKE